MGARHRKSSVGVYRNVALMVFGILLIINSVIWGLVMTRYGH